MDFIKMHGLGNDFIMIDQFAGQTIQDPAALARSLCQRRFSVGADGLVLVLPSESAHARMRIFNPDGSEPEMCGNAIRCVARFLCERGYVRGERMSVETLAGMMNIAVRMENGRFVSASVDMGAPVITGRHAIALGQTKVCFAAVSTGNPHAVTYGFTPNDAQFAEYGPYVERHSVFPAGTNVEFCRVEDRTHAHVRVWERGAGPTMACGTGATASFFTGVRDGLLDKYATMSLPGGDLTFELLENGHVIMTGPADIAFRGSI